MRSQKRPRKELELILHTHKLSVGNFEGRTTISKVMTLIGLGNDRLRECHDASRVGKDTKTKESQDHRTVHYQHYLQRSYHLLSTLHKLPLILTAT